jgi:peptidyl-tRNA hydrolase, PTH1 family
LSSKIQLIVGLGNPGPEYENTRHNVGAWLVDALAKQHELTLRAETKFRGSVAKFSSAGASCWLLRPSTYMNESGQSVLSFAHFYKILPQSILVVHDELDFDAGIIRIKDGGGHGGHNGLRDIKQHLKTGDFLRLRIGIGHPGDKDRVSPYVLSKPSRADHGAILQSIDEGLAAVPDLIDGEIQKAFRFLHS